MKKLTSPVALIKESVNLFFDKKNLIFFLKIYSFLLPFVAISVTQAYLLKQKIDIMSYSWSTPVFSILSLLYLGVSILVWIATIEALKIILKKDKFSVKNVFTLAMKNFLPFFVLSVVLFLIIAAGLVLLIVPGIIFLTWFIFSRFILIENKLPFSKALARSREVVLPVFWPVLGRITVFGLFTILVDVFLSFVPYGLGSIVNTLIGGLFIIPTYLLYKELV